MVAVPGAGKSTIAKEIVRKDPSNWVRINRDDLRMMMNGGAYSDELEMVVAKTAFDMAKKALKKGLNVISDDTNLKGKVRKQWHKIAEKVGDVEVIEKYIDVDLKTALKRNAGRPVIDQVPEGVVKKFFTKFINKNLNIVPKSYYPPSTNGSFYIKQDESLQKCILVDIDGTIAKMTNRGPFDWSAVYKDDVNEPVHELLKFIQHCNWTDMEHCIPEEDMVKIIFLSGRDGHARDETIRWFADKTWFPVTYGDNLFMRAPDDIRRDSIIKDELYEAEIKGKYNVLFVLDDRDQMVEHWREVVGIPCFQVAEGDF